uniref:Uncharacterized protein n=1 Tax=Timema shepardi TaxID=629360 RepID=A0A7R9G1C9_TIMSH|nr:unnamed protein product [Timema shepardi]
MLPLKSLTKRIRASQLASCHCHKLISQLHCTYREPLADPGYCVNRSSEAFMMFLGVWGKLLVIAIGAAVVVLVVLIVVCFVGPGCWGYQCLHKEEEEKKKRLEFGDCQEGKKFENVDLADLSSSKRKKSNLVYDSVAVGSQLGRLPQHRDSTYSSMSENSERRSLSFRVTRSFNINRATVEVVLDMVKSSDPVYKRFLDFPLYQAKLFQFYLSYSTEFNVPRLECFNNQYRVFTSYVNDILKDPDTSLSMLTEDSAVTTNGTSTCTNKENPPVLNMSLQFLIITDADIVTEVLNNNIQTEDGASGNEEDTSSLVPERPIPSAAEAMDDPISKSSGFF